MKLWDVDQTKIKIDAGNITGKSYIEN